MYFWLQMSLIETEFLGGWVATLFYHTATEERFIWQLFNFLKLIHKLLSQAPFLSFFRQLRTVYRVWQEVSGRVCRFPHKYICMIHCTTVSKDMKESSWREISGMQPWLHCDGNIFPPFSVGVQKCVQTHLPSDIVGWQVVQTGSFQAYVALNYQKCWSQNSKSYSIVICPPPQPGGEKHIMQMLRHIYFRFNIPKIFGRWM